MTQNQNECVMNLPECSWLEKAVVIWPPLKKVKEKKEVDDNAFRKPTGLLNRKKSCDF